MAKKPQKQKQPQKQPAPVAPPAPPQAKKDAKPAKGKEKKDEGKLLALTADERLRLRLYESETVRWAAEANLRQGKKAAFIAKMDPEGLLGKMDNEIRATVERSQQSRVAYQKLTAEIEARLGIKLAEYAFDDETGVLMPAAK